MIPVALLLVALASNSIAFNFEFGGSLSSIFSYQNYYEWKKVEYKFANNSQRDQMIKDKTFIQENCAITAPKVYKNRMILTTPRYKQGVPSTLNVVSYSSNYFSSYFGTKAPVLQPFPSWEMQQEGNCTAFQLVQGMEVDQYGRLWAVDVGRTRILEPKPQNLCPAKVVIIDMKNGDKIVKSYNFPSDVVSPTINGLKDIQVACTSETDCFAYISDIFGNQVIVFDYKNEKSWYAKHPSMAPKPDKMNFTIEKTPVSAPFGVAGSAVSPIAQNFTTYYFSPIADTLVYATNTSILRSPQANFNLTDEQVWIVGNRTGQSDGWAMTNTGKLYVGNLPKNQVDEIQTSKNATQRLPGATKKIQNDKDLQWPDTFAFDNEGHILLTTNKFQLYDSASYDWNQINFRVVRFSIKDKAYSQK